MCAQVLGRVYVNQEAVDEALVDLLYGPSCDPGAREVFVSVVTGEHTRSAPMRDESYSAFHETWRPEEGLYAGPLGPKPWEVMPTPSLDQPIILNRAWSCAVVWAHRCAADSS